MLLLVAAGGGNIPTRALLDDTVFAVTAVYADRHDPAALPLPPHGLIFNAIGDADLCGAALQTAGAIVARSTAPVINPPDVVSRRTWPRGRRGPPARRACRGRDRSRGHVWFPRLWPRSAPTPGFPRLFRSPGFHTGRHFVRVERREDLDAAIVDLPGDALLAIEPLDARGPDGRFRKYRAMLIGGAVFPLHLAISAHWKVHYFSAAMADATRASQGRGGRLPGRHAGCMIGPRAMAALQAIAAELRLDYAGVELRRRSADGRS